MDKDKLATPLEDRLDQFYAADGTKIVFRHWHPETFNQRILVLLHRGHEHSARMAEMADFFVQQGYSVYAWDARGNGLSEGERDHADSYAQLAHDLDLFIQRIEEESGINRDQFVVIASSVGAVIATAWLHDYAPKIRGIILATPAFKIRLYIPFSEPLLAVAQKFKLMPRVSSYVKSRMLTHDRQQQQIYNEDPLISTSISTPLLLDTLKTGRRLVDDAGAITTPLLLLSAGKDWVVHRSPQRRFYERLSSEHKEWHYNPNAHHALFIEDDRNATYQRCLTFIESVFEREPRVPDLCNADQHGYSRDRYDAMALPCYNPSYPLMRWTIKQFGGISQGIKIGRDLGFDSGASLEYVYNNTATGKSPIGRWIDRIYLDSPGWQGIRQRKVLLKQQINRCIDSLKARQENDDSALIRIVDIAAGNGQYLFELAAQHADMELELRDLKSNNIDIMSRVISERNLDERAQAVKADAFAAQTYSSEERYQIAVSSGVFELFSTNAFITAAIKGIHSQLGDNGFYVYTNQPWHSQQKLIAKTLNDHQGKLWSMRCRTQAEMDALVEAEGFKKIGMLIDNTGMFTVSIARKG
ncbi:bifunctional alpha/beta hydrolase/class I SAM-dependent methyltransferase [Marinobacterium lutimaris]|uniref:Lysophospholipase, alpha-beta hydrolase superfamily n=1 Tax=Marinobacterium lutimaris TaxID=568106 RepID=A0A1H6BC99_9GAMM|nr:bifunctional alpha/beta hydrolase/class I SAM-dependent methyltransferase [Marinobacterium lutimaris]SEG58451.1 Lysophospholipase, alpha-beta hydrolase superfamily [Marinobacterium lutimaris]